MSGLSKLKPVLNIRSLSESRNNSTRCIPTMTGACHGTSHDEIVVLDAPIPRPNYRNISGGMPLKSLHNKDQR